MAKRPTTIINGVTYSKKTFEQKWKQLVLEKIGVRFSGENHLFLTEVCNRNPPWAKILARGPNFYFKTILKKFHGRKVRGIALVTPNTSREIWIGKAKALEIVFPPTITVASNFRNNKKLALQALRQIVEPQMTAYRRSIRRQIKSKSGFKIRCAITKQSLDHGEFHIDHVYPFKNIVEDWCRECRVDLENLDVVCRGTKCSLKDKTLAESFFDYHLLVAQLQPTTPKANLLKGAKYGAPINLYRENEVQESHSKDPEQPSQPDLPDAS